MATYNDQDIFGPGPTMDHDDPPNAAQVSHYPGVRGVERLDLGPRETYTTVRGTLVGNSVDDVGAACIAIRTIKNNGTIGTLIDTDGVTWSDAILVSFRTTGRCIPAPGLGWCRDYEMTFLHTNTGQGS